MNQKVINTLTQCLIVSVGITASISACSLETLNTSEAIKQSAFAQSNPEEIYKLGLAYYERDTVPEDDRKAFDLFKQAAKQGYAPAQYYLSVMYYQANGEHNYKKAFLWAQRAANQGDTDAQFNVATMYENGVGVDQDYKKAVQWYSLAATNDSSDAQNNLGSMYYFGRGVPQSYIKAFEWYKKAAKKGVALAQFNLGGLYENGQGVEQDYDMAYKWYKKAADQGSQVARDKIRRLVMSNKKKDAGIIIYNTEDTGLTLGDIEKSNIENRLDNIE